jgi:hypothetical protein
MKNFEYFLNREYEGLNKWSQRLKELISNEFSLKITLMNTVFNSIRDEK